MALGNPNSVAIVYDYSSLNRLTNMSVVHGLSTIANYAYTLTASGHRIGATETLHATTLKRLYAYDRTYRLTNETISGSGFSIPATLG